MLTPRSATLIAATLPLVSEHMEQISADFYRRLFSAHPALESDLFNRGNQARGDQQRALAGAVVAFARHLTTPGAPPVAELMARISNKHASLGIVEDQYPVVHEHLFAAIAAVLGDAVTADVGAAWNEVYWLMADELVAAESALYRHAHVGDGEVWGDRLVIDRQQAAEGTVSLVLAAPEGQPPLPSFLPGQFISVQMRLPDGAEQIRQYSLSSSPGMDGRWRITVRRIEPTRGSHAAYLPGEVSNAIVDTVHEGDTIRTSLPFGAVGLPDEGVPLVMISAGAGITPFLGILHYLADTGDARTIRVLHSDRTPERLAHRGELDELLARLPGADAVLWFTDGRAQEDRHLRVSATDVPDGAVVVVCGPIPFMTSVRAQLIDAGVDPGLIRTAVFGPEPDPLRDPTAPGTRRSRSRHGRHAGEASSTGDGKP
ncbi:globin domain-containing protein [Mycetocola reblochoni]|uniref:nitric oxide dioxygenase n=2 Tax=Mycetocola reblochoni TaxID=331618 RepID=A0A1R4JVF9_9MICO|nr:globin domain-containing protein [Mycetocola reblochoni]RLP70638.1 hemin transporter [Mycetocola reblochoni]SJN36251.1 Flavohemoprotein (Hemoglobin-like protein) (Flavohemoglobin) (Nitric oxide dioxygenase) [Mycetocola reblochoni REB411]